MKKIIIGAIVFVSFIFGVFAPVYYSLNLSGENSGVGVYKAEAKKTKKKKKKKKTTKKKKTKKKKKPKAKKTCRR